MKILVADDHVFVRKGIISILSAEFPTAVFTECNNGEAVLESVAASIWDLVILDINMPEKNGIDTIRSMRAADIKVPVLIMSMQPENQYVIRAMQAGASGYVNKATATEELVKAVHKVLAGKKYVSETLKDLLELSRLKNKTAPSLAVLSPRELEVMKLMAEGYTVTDIAKKMSVSITAISTHRTHILEKLSLKNNVDIIRFYMESNPDIV